MRKVFVTIVVMILGGCATNRPEEAQFQGWRGKSMALAVPPARFSAVTGGTAFLSGATNGWWDGGAASKGATLAAENDIVVPSAQVGQGLIQAARERYGVVAVPLPVIAVNALSNPSQLARAATGADLVLELSAATMLVIRLSSPGHYNVLTSMDARVIEVASAKTLVSAQCRESSSGEENPPTYNELLADKAARAKAYIVKQSAACSQELKSALLGGAT
jgi:hypothetical protein